LVAKTVTLVLVPAFSWDILLAPMFLHAVVLTIWMLARGVDREKWDRALGQRQGSARPPGEAPA
jgi:hypothetical protein